MNGSLLLKRLDMEKEYLDILGIYPGMYASKFHVRKDSWCVYTDNYMNESTNNTCFIPAKDTEGDPLWVDMHKLLAFYVLNPKKDEKNLVKKPKKKKASE